MTALSISLPPELGEAVERKVREGCFADASDYFATLVREDIEREGDWELDDATIAAIREGEASGFSTRIPEEIFAEARARYLSS